MKIAITGGHHTSALPVIDYVQETYPDTDIVWFGHRHSMKGNANDTLEYKEITRRSIPFIELKAGKFYKTFDPVRLAKIPYGFFQALYYLIKEKPQVILSFGGYLAVPVVLMGWVLGIPSVTHEQTVVTGYANKVIGIFARKILISHAESREFFPEEKTVFTGIPLRRALFQVKTNSFVFENDLPILYITAGKTGSHKINMYVKDILPQILSLFNVIHQCGDHSDFHDYDELEQLYSTIQGDTGLGKYYLRRFVLEDEIGEVFSKSSFFLARSGAHTTYEIRTFKKPSVLIPIPWVSHNEQLENAKVLEDMGLAIILEEKDLSSKSLLESLEVLRSKEGETKTYTPEYTTDSVEKIFDQVLAAYEKKNP